MSSKCKISSFAKVRRGASPRPIGDQKYFGGMSDGLEYLM